MQPLNAQASHGAIAGKVAKVTIAFWIIKIIATTLGETGGDALSMPPISLGYEVASTIFLVFFAVTVISQVAAKRYHPALFWAVIVATTTLGTTVSDWLTRDLKLFGNEGPYYGPTALVLFIVLIIVLVIWRIVTGSISVSKITSKESEAFYWCAILVSNTLGTALGDWLADTNDFGFEKGAMVFGTAIVIVGLFYLFTKISRPILFWAAFILTRPLGATLGDIITKPLAKGGLNLSRPISSLVILACMIPLIYFFSRSSESPQDFEVDSFEEHAAAS